MPIFKVLFASGGFLIIPSLSRSLWHDGEHYTLVFSLRGRCFLDIGPDVQLVHLYIATNERERELSIATQKKKCVCGPVVTPAYRKSYGLRRNLFAQRARPNLPNELFMRIKAALLPSVSSRGGWLRLRHALCLRAKI